MAETNGAGGAQNGQNGAGEGQQQIQPKVGMLSQYVRDLSFENVAIMKGAQPQGRPDISVNVNLDAKNKGENRHEVALKLTATAKAGEETVFIAELDYAGLFTIEGVPETHLHPFLLIECPRLLFPFARRVLADVTRDGGYPPLMLDVIDFAQLYRQEIERRAAQQGAQPAQA